MNVSNMKVNDDTKRHLFVVLAVIIVLIIILPLVLSRFEHNGVQLRHNRALSWTLIIIHSISVIAAVLWLALFFYKDWLRNRIDNIERAARMRIVVSVMWWLIITMLVLLGTQFFIDVYRGSHRLVFASIQFVILSLGLGCLLLNSWTWVQYCRTQPLCNIVAAGLLEHCDKFLHAHDFDKAYAALVKASETAPDETEIWCRLAHFCEAIRKDTTEADKHLAKAKELITTKKAGSDSDKSCYLNYLGAILYERGEYKKGLEYMKQSIDIEPRPGRIVSYEKKLSEFKNSQSGTTDAADV